MAKKVAEKPLNFKVSAAFHKEFKVYAASHGMSMRELLELGFELVKKKRPQKCPPGGNDPRGVVGNGCLARRRRLSKFQRRDHMVAMCSQAFQDRTGSPLRWSVSE